jgi:Transglutaminase-like superfamily
MRQTLDPEDRRYDRVAICLDICGWMRSQGFVAAMGKSNIVHLCTSFSMTLVTSDTYHDMRNHFLLTTHRKTLLLSLIGVFIAISNRLGIPSKAVGFPGHVHAFVPLSLEASSSRIHISPYYDALNKGIHVNVFNSNTAPLIDIISLL